LAYLTLFVRAERGWNSFFRREGQRGYATLLAMPAIAGISGGIFGAVMSEMLDSYLRPDQYSWRDQFPSALFLVIGFVIAFALPIGLMNGERSTKSLSIPARIHRLRTTESTDLDKRDLLAELDKQLQTMTDDRGRGKLRLALLLLIAAGIDIGVTVEAVQLGGDWAVVASISAATIAAALVARLVFRPRWNESHYADLASYRPEIVTFAPASKTPELQVVHHHHYERQGPWAPLSIGLGLGAAVMWILRSGSWSRR
jgi:hypothetical protein